MKVAPSWEAQTCLLWRMRSNDEGAWVETHVDIVSAHRTPSYMMDFASLLIKKE